MKIIDGKLVSSTIRNEIKENILNAERNYGKKFKLSVIIAGDDPASEIYVRNKEKACAEVGIMSETVHLPENVSQNEIESEILLRVNDDAVDGILVQLPLPEHLDKERILKLIPPEKDVDGFSDENTGKLALGKSDGLYPCTPHGIIKLLKYYDIPLAGKNAVIIGRSNIVGKPLALMLLSEDCTVTVCHSKTKNLEDHISRADILVTAVGKKWLVDGKNLKDGVVIVDAGINRDDGKIYGDVNFDSASQKADYITPVPGGVGPMTITMLLYNTYLAGIRKTEK